MDKMKAIPVYMREDELNALRLLKTDMWDEGRVVSISGMLRELAIEYIRKAKAAIAISEGRDTDDVEAGAA
jgi:hypothetical protein